MITRILFAAVLCLITKTIYGDSTGNTFMGTGSLPVAAGEFPSFVRITIPPNGQCGGFIINQNHVVTAGSCVLDANHHLIGPASLTIHFGFTSFPAVNAPSAAVERVYVHPLFNPWNFDNDIAVLRTVGNISIQDTRAPTIFPAEINDRIVADNEICTFVGIASVAPAPGTVRALNQSVVSRTACIALNNFANNVVPSQFCAGDNTPNGGCLPNRGGPLFCNNRVSGILSNRFSCLPLNLPNVYTQIRLYIPWIAQQFTRNDLTPAGPTQHPTFPLAGQSTILGCMSLVILSVFGLLLAG